MAEGEGGRGRDGSGDTQVALEEAGGQRFGPVLVLLQGQTQLGRTRDLKIHKTLFFSRGFWSCGSSRTIGNTDYSLTGNSGAAGREGRG